MTVEHLRLWRWFASSSAVALLFTLYIVPRAALVFFSVEPASDAAWYFNRAVALAAGHGYSERGLFTAYWPPGWPLTLALVFKLFGPSIFIVKVVNLLCAMATGWFTLDLGRKLFNSELAGRVALLLLAIYPNNIGYVAAAMTEVFYTTLLLAILWLLIVCQAELRFALAGLILGLATLVKTQSLVVLPFIFGIAILRQHITLHQVRLVLFRAGLVTLTACFVIVPWTLRNHAVFNKWIFVSTNGGLTLLTGNNPSARGDYTPDDPLVTSISRSVANQVSVDKEARRRAVEWIKGNPGRFIWLMPMKWFRLWAPDGESEWWFQAGYKQYDKYVSYFRAVRYLNQAYYILLLLGFIWSGFLLFSGRAKISELRFDWWMLPYSITLYVTLLSLVFSGQSRFHYPIMPIVVMCTGWLLASNFFVQERTRFAAPSDALHPVASKFFPTLD